MKLHLIRLLVVTGISDHLDRHLKVWIVVQQTRSQSKLLDKRKLSRSMRPSRKEASVRVSPWQDLLGEGGA